MESLTEIGYIFGPERGITVEVYNTIGLRHWLQSGFEEFLKLVQDLEKKKNRQKHKDTNIVTT